MIRRLLDRLPKVTGPMPAPFAGALPEFLDEHLRDPVPPPPAKRLPPAPDAWNGCPCGCLALQVQNAHLREQLARRTS